ncbi:MAG TPA: hypothetical protein VHU85_09495 [Acidimicrobiales bacterium]|jgi:hypothetical protein|nr:hypothetical protein [Acidimicrobiales bacterium]
MAPTGYEPAGVRGANNRRDLALHRVGKVTRRVAVATVASVGILGLYVSRALPGHASTSTPATTTPAGQNPAPPTTSPSVAGSSGASTPQPVPAAPVSPPTTTPRRVHVTTGAS